MTAAYIHRLNVERYERLLRAETDPAKREQIMKLLAEERASDRPQHRPDRPDADETAPC